MPSKRKPSLVVLIPALNEEATIGSVIGKIPRKVAGLGKVLVLVVDDGSTDRTVQKARLAKADRVVSHGVNRGLGIAFKTGIENALAMGAGIIVNMDADGQFNPGDIGKLVSPILAGRADVVTCSRFREKALMPRMPFVKRLGNRLFTGIINLFTGSSFTDTQCGFRAYSREAALRLSLFARFTYTQETLIDLIGKGMRIEEVACWVQGERQGKSRIVKSWYSYGFRALAIVVRALRDYRPMEFFGGMGTLVFGAGFLGAVYFWLFSARATQVWEVYAIGLLIVLGFLLMVLALIADMLDRQRRIQEEILYRERKKGI